MLSQGLKVVKLPGKMWLSCRTCNTIKGNKLIDKTGFKLNVKPYIPNNYELKEIGRMFPPNFLHKSWNDFLIGTQN